MKEKEKVLEILKKAGKPSKHIAELTGIGKKEVSKVINELKKDGLILGKGYYYGTK